jgi:hypothetical protein
MNEAMAAPDRLGAAASAFAPLGQIRSRGIDRSTRFSHASDSLSRYPHHGKFTDSNFGVDV